MAVKVRRTMVLTIPSSKVGVCARDGDTVDDLMQNVADVVGATLASSEGLRNIFQKWMDSWPKTEARGDGGVHQR